MKKILSFLLTLFIFAISGLLIYLNKTFVIKQINKVRAVYYVDKGDSAYQCYDMNKAIKFYSKALRYYPEHYDAWYNLGNIYVVYEDYQDAAFAYAQAFKYNPNMMIARINYGIIASEKLQNFDDAIKQYNEVLKTRRHIVTVPYVFDNKLSTIQNLAIASYNKGVTYRMKALYLAANNPRLKYKYMHKAIDAYENSVKIYPDNFDAQYNLGTLYQIMNDLDRASRAYCKAIKIAPLNYEAHYNYAILLKRLRYYQEAYDEIDKAITLVTTSNESTGVQQYIARVYNDISYSLYNDTNYQKYLTELLNDEKNEIKKEMAKNGQKTKEKDKDALTPPILHFKNGKIDLSDDSLSESIIREFRTCPNIKKYRSY